MGFSNEQPLMNADTGVSDGGASTNVGNVTTTDSQQTQSPVGDSDSSTNVVTTTPTNEIEIDGLGKVKFDDIKEWQKGHMRQSDYTKKTQEVAKQRQEAKEALEVFNYLKNNPQIAQALSNGDVSAIQNNPAFNSLNPQYQQYNDVNMKMATLELDLKLNDLKSRYPDFNEVEVLTEADKLGITDLEFVYNALQGKKLPTLKEQIKKEIEASLTSKIRQNGLDTGTIINDNDAITHNANFGLNEAEMKIASKMGLSYESYANGKKRIYNNKR
jgi:predicted DNA binding CopG/RHH family protein